MLHVVPYPCLAAATVYSLLLQQTKNESLTVSPYPKITVSANLKAGGAPELLSALLEGESLFNDASGLVEGGEGRLTKGPHCGLMNLEVVPLGP